MWQKELKGSIPGEEYHGSSALTDGGSNDGERPEVGIFRGDWWQRHNVVVSFKTPAYDVNISKLFAKLTQKPGTYENTFCMHVWKNFLKLGEKNYGWRDIKSNSFRKACIIINVLNS